MEVDLESRDVCLTMAMAQVERSLELTRSLYGTNVKALALLENERTNRVAKWYVKRGIKKCAKNAAFQAGLAIKAVEDVIEKLERDESRGFVAENVDDWMKNVNENEDEIKGAVEMTRVFYQICREAKDALKNMSLN